MASPEIEYWNTSNGTEVYYVHAPQLPMVDIQIIFDAGSIRDDGQLGIAMLSNSLLAEGADGLDADMISKGFESLGAIYSSDVGYDSASLHHGQLLILELNEFMPINEIIKKIESIEESNPNLISFDSTDNSSLYTISISGDEKNVIDHVYKTFPKANISFATKK